MGINKELTEEDIKFRYITTKPSQARDGQRIVYSWNRRLNILTLKVDEL